MRRFLVGVVVVMAGCTAKFGGELSIDGAAFKPTECRSGQALGFSGVEISDAGGQRLRLLANPDGTANAALFAPNEAKGQMLGNCGVLSAKAQNSRVNNITNLKGTATLSCEGSGHKLNGKLEFENCH